MSILNQQPVGHAANALGSSSRDGTITDLEAAKLLLDAWKFRQGHAWSSLTRYFLAAAFLSSVPYILKEELVHRLKVILLLLPILGGVVALAAVWLYAAEYIRAQSMNREFRKLLQDYGYYGAVDLRLFEQIILAPKIGWTTVYVLGAASLILSGVNVLIVWLLVRLS